MGFVIRELLAAGLLHADIMTVAGAGLGDYAREPALDGDALVWREAPAQSGDETMLRPPARPFRADGGMRLVSGNLGRATFKTSAVAENLWSVEAPARVFDTQEAVQAAFKAGELDRDVVVVVRFQGPRANGMPELHKLTPALGVLIDKGFRVALVTDGRMSGASGKVPAAIHCVPEAFSGGALGRLRDGDMIHVCAHTGTLTVRADLAGRAPAAAPVAVDGVGRELFAMLRAGVDGAETGASAMLVAAGL
jgi:phosphogluconate dehydratase